MLTNKRCTITLNTTSVSHHCGYSLELGFLKYVVEFETTGRFPALDCHIKPNVTGFKAIFTEQPLGLRDYRDVS